ncbi:TRAM domain-containing protein [Natrinema thermotolerans]|uniref:TRAM domain-containing protein n=1 Tax=Natrinema thermotolerans TaxID=121872 RepID=A0AAF0PER7_9EURY|nr:TRAM domain-containing protein [Natrinema thermotolerans]ELZ09681.1 hypothetical protein C478_15917 [Natrinema thermotolerans DSM 11552]QCC60310.1 TRAM domain-containing protein [Natrinema thermotolerans]QCC61219.1 TRAM domain-containing protein [Natrinema thermotolerans]WMT07333.1 TRAM domain-containing protein [Natrinema thermotolerans]
MSIFGKYLTGWTFRANRPSLEVGSEIDVFISETNGSAGRAYIGDTELLVEGAGPETVEKQVRVRVTDFDETTATGEGDLVEVVGESSYSG